MISFTTTALLLTTFLSLFCCYLVVRKACWKKKFFYILFYASVYLYSGLGGCLTEADARYRLYYYFYIITFTGFSLLFFSLKGMRSFSVPLESRRLESFHAKYAKIFIVFYLFLGIAELMYPVFRLSVLIHPPSPDIQNRLSFYSDAQSYSSFIGTIKNLLSPFFFWSLFKYRLDIKKMGIILLFNMYVSYCSDAYMSRGVMLVTLAVLFFSYFFSISKERKRRLLIIAGIGAPFLILFFVYYSFTRIGISISDISISDVMGLIIKQEIDSPLLFDRYINESGQLISEYFEWFFLLPFPSPLKMGHGGTLFNELFTNVSLGRYNWETDFSIALPGIVGESIFVFGRYFYCHAIILSFVLSIVYRFLEREDSFLVLFVYISVKSAQALPRAGTQSLYSYFAKSLLFLAVIVYFIKKNKKKNENLPFSHVS